MNGHLLYTSTDPDRPHAICDMNGDVVLSQCRLCGRAEHELSEPCVRNEQLDTIRYGERDDVRWFQSFFEVPMASQPSLLNEELFRFRAKFLHEEIMEFIEGHNAGNLCDAADALVDLAYVLHGTALMMGLPWDDLWTEVHKKNMQKVRVLHVDESKRGSVYDIRKPKGWTPPDHRRILGDGPWPVFNP